MTYDPEYQRSYYQRNRERVLASARARRSLIATYQTSQRAEIRSAISMLKMEQGCSDCGYDVDPVALDFDHLGDKKHAVAHMVTNRRSMEAILAEIDKCEVVCANCHRIRTDVRRGGGA